MQTWIYDTHVERNLELSAQPLWDHGDGGKTQSDVANNSNPKQLLLSLSREPDLSHRNLAVGDIHLSLLLSPTLYNVFLFLMSTMINQGYGMVNRHAGLICHPILSTLAVFETSRSLSSLLRRQ
jgi:hypothetical protein